ncbi:MAG: hypothetical protein AB1473_00255 [Thermodesulfobacteriota bacterium]
MKTERILTITRWQLAMMLVLTLLSWVEIPRAVETPDIQQYAQTELPGGALQRPTLRRMNAGTCRGKVVSSSPTALEVEVTQNGTTQVILVRIGRKTKFMSFRRPALGETVEVEYKPEKGSRFGYVVKVINP